MAKSCPLCGGALSNNICAECGYELPDENTLDKMSELYNFEPEDYPEPKYEEDIMPERARVTYAEPEEDLRHFEVRSANAEASPQNIPHAGNTGNSGYVNRAGVYPANVPNQYNNQNSNNKQSGGKIDFSSIDALFTNSRMKTAFLVLSLILPLFGIISGAVIKRNSKNKDILSFATVLIVIGVIKLLTPL